MNSQTSVLVDRLLTVLREDVLPMTQAGVRDGNKVFGAAVLRKASLELVVAGTNEEARNPLLHGEISCLNRYWSLPPKSRPQPADCLFLSSHEPCPMCLAAIAWSGFDNFYYLFSYEDTRDDFEIPARSRHPRRALPLPRWCLCRHERVLEELLPPRSGRVRVAGRTGEVAGAAR